MPDAAKDLVSSVTSAILPAKLFRLAIVAKIIDYHNVVLNRGSADGVRIGNKFLIFGIGEDIKDPESGDSLGSLEIVKGVGTVSHVQEKISVLTSSKKQDVLSPTRIIKRQPNRLGYITGFVETEEIIEQHSGNSPLLPFDGPEVGDRARPI